jgi:HK97 family phage major capsid protein
MMAYEQKKQELVEGVEYVRAQLEDLSTRTEFGDDEQVRWDEGMEYIRAADAELARIEKFEADQIELAKVAKRSVSFSGDGAAAPFQVSVRTEDPFDLSSARFASDSDLVERALTVIEESRHFVEDDHQENATRTIESMSKDRGRGARQIIAAADPRYRSAFARVNTGGDLTGDERAALAQVDAVLRDGDFFQPTGTSQRALAVANITGKLVPAHLDPSVVLTNDGVDDVMRSIARVEKVSTNVWTGVSSDGVTAGWTGAEGTEVGDDAPEFANPAVTCHMADAFVPISFQAYEDWMGGEAELVRMFADAKDRLEAVAHETGSGSDQPFGIVTALDANTNVEVAMATNSAFTAADLFKLQQALPKRYRRQAQYLMALEYIDRIRAFGSNDNYAYTVDLTAAGIPALLGKALNEANAMTGLLSTATNNAIVYGDFKNYLIADRIGMVVEFIPNLTGITNGRPVARRGWLAHWRTGADSINDKGFRLLQNPAS